MDNGNAGRLRPGRSSEDDRVCAHVCAYMRGCLRVRDKPSVYEVARHAGVSTATVSRVLAGHERVLPGTRDKVLSAVTELGYVPSGAARDLAARRTGVLGLCFPDLDTEDTEDGAAAYWYDEVIRGMERAARRSGYAVLIAASHHRDDSGMVLSIAGRCDGLVVLARTAPLAMIEHVATRIPVVLLATEEAPDGSPADRAIDFLTVANETGAYQVTAHLADVHGYADICFIAGPPDSPDSGRRLDGFRRATAGLGRVLVHYGDFTTAGGRRVAERILAGGRVPRALVCANDQTAIGAMTALQQAGLSVPGDVAVTGFDGIRLGRHLRPSLTTVVQPMAAPGVTAMAFLTDRIGGAGQPTQTLPRRTVEL